jgi:Zn-dependent protease with chaperone function
MENGAIWVYKGLLDDVSDDELAAVLGHELAHYTHEHVRRGTRNGALVQLAALGAQAAIDGMQGSNRSAGLALVASLSLSAWRNRYSRGLEDQADRVGLRYAHEAGYDVTAAVRLWKRVREQKGEADPVSNFFGGDHSRPTDRIKNIERELLLNYTPTAGQ